MGIALWHFGRAMALAAKADLESARGEQRLFEQLRSRLPKDTMWMFNSGDKLLAVASPVLAARLEPDPEQAIPIWRKPSRPRTNSATTSLQRSTIPSANHWEARFFAPESLRRQNPSFASVSSKIRAILSPSSDSAKRLWLRANPMPQTPCAVHS